MALSKFAQLSEKINKVIPKRSGLSLGEIATSYIGLLCMGKFDFDAIENHRQDSFFSEALGLQSVPAASTLRMQMDSSAEKLIPLVDESLVSLIKTSRYPLLH